MKTKLFRPTVLFDASVILSGLKSPSGGSGKLIKWVKNKKIVGIISTAILIEINKHLNKMGINQKQLESLVNHFIVTQDPHINIINQYSSIIVDQNDVHVLAIAKEIKTKYLVTLDKKHLLILKNKIKEFKIVTPGDLIQKLSSN